MRFGWTVFVVLLLSGAQAAADGDSIRGFSESGSRAQRALEERFDSHYKKDNLREWMKILSAHPHHVGSPHGKQNAEFVAAAFREWGYETEIETFYVLFPTPKVRVLEIVEPTSFGALLQEPALAEDATSGQIDEQLPTYNAYSPDGDVTAEIVYVNRGIPDDYEELDKRGISVEGRIVLARYGGSWRGIKPKVAAEHGAVGVILYSDPTDDGYSQGAAYPEDEFKTEHTVQRGSILDMPLRAGDPLTPNRGATKKAKRLKRADVETLPTIPTLPISYHDAMPILKALAGPVAPESWRGTLPLTYRMGPGPVTVHMKLEFNWDTVPAYDVIARMKGSVWPDQWIMRGNHHDAWVNGAADPISGLVSLMEEARVVAELARAGQPPKRSPPGMPKSRD
jgi:N-acetylated-alpha-linked acidic dipeptidase